MSAGASMSDAREVILDRVRRAQAIRPVTVEVTREYHGPGQLTVPDLVALFAERVGDYRARVRHCGADDVVDSIAAALAERKVGRIVTPAGLPAAWLAAVGEPVVDEPHLSSAELDAVDGVLTTAAVAIATTGTIVLDAGPGQGRRALTLVPDYHLAVVFAGQIVAAVPDAVALLDPVRPLTWISGPSATSDIELNRVEGVHGPRQLEVLIVE
jgi:L-lactate dehydrogenase complex protein LldG